MPTARLRHFSPPKNFVAYSIRNKAVPLCETIFMALQRFLRFLLRRAAVCLPPFFYDAVHADGFSASADAESCSIACLK